MRTPVILVAGQGDTEGIVDELLRRSGTLAVRHRYDGHVVLRSTHTVDHGVPTVTETALELAHGCTSCTIRNDLLILLRRLHQRDDVTRIVVHLAPWLEPEPICWAVRHVRVSAPGFVDGPAARDVAITAVITCVEEFTWLQQALGDDDLADGRTVAQVVVGQAEFADVLLCRTADPELPAVLRRLSPRAEIIDDARAVEVAVASLPSGARRGRSSCPHDPMLDGQPPLEPTGRVSLVEFYARRPFHPGRLDAALGLLLEGVVRTRGRMWLANNIIEAMWLETAGGGWRATSAGKWLAAMDTSELAYVAPERRALADVGWDRVHGDRHTALTALVCGADPDEIFAALSCALLTDAEMDNPGEWSDYGDPFEGWSETDCTTDDLVSSGEDGDHR